MIPLMAFAATLIFGGVLQVDAREALFTIKPKSHAKVKIIFMVIVDI